jgi:predicted permease
MLARSLNKLENQNFGFAVANRIAIQLSRPPATYTSAQLDSLYIRLEERLARLPGVQGTGLAMYNPLTDNWGESIMVEGHPKGKITDNLNSSWDRVSSNYLQNAGVPLLRGRYFNDGDNAQSELVAVVNQAFVKKFFASHEEPLDHHFGIDLPELAGTFRIVGVVGDAKFAGFALSRPARPMFYVPLKQYVPYKHPLMARLELASHFIEGIMLVTSSTAGSVEPVLTRALAEIDPNLTILRVQTVRDEIGSSFEEERAVAGLAGLFGVVALLLAAIGLYGVTAYTVAQRTQEIGIRMALGADRRSVVRMVLAGASKRVLLGLLVGIPLAIGAGKLISSKLYGVSSWDPTALAVAAIALAISAFFAAIIPAGRAASISPMTALRNE